MHYTKYYKFHLFDKKIIYHQPSIDFTSNTGFFKKNLDCGGMKRKFFSSSEKEEEKKEHGRKKWKLFSFYPKIRKDRAKLLYKELSLKSIIF